MLVWMVGKHCRKSTGCNVIWELDGAETRCRRRWKRWEPMIMRFAIRFVAEWSTTVHSSSLWSISERSITADLRPLFELMSNDHRRTVCIAHVPMRLGMLSWRRGDGGGQREGLLREVRGETKNFLKFGQNALVYQEIGLWSLVLQTENFLF